MNKENSFSFNELFENEGKNCKIGEKSLFQYFEDQLLEEDRLKFEQHLVFCTFCSGKLAELQETEAASLKTELDSGFAEKILDQNRARIEIHLDQKYHLPKTETASSEGVFSRLFRIFTLPGYANAMVIALLLVLIYPAYKSFEKNREISRLQSELDVEKSKKAAGHWEITATKNLYEQQIRDLKEQQRILSEPSISSSAVFPARPERSGNTETIEVRFSEKEKYFSILFSLPPNYDPYQVQILQNEKPIWQNEFRPEKRTDSTPVLISLNLKSSYFQEGSYQLRVSGAGKNGMDTLSIYKLKVIRR